MISFEDFLMEDDSPIYLQIIRYIKRGIAAGNIRHQEELPSRRVLSAFLGVNPNTIQKAYRVLEEEGLIESEGADKGMFHTVDGVKADYSVNQSYWAFYVGDEYAMKGIYDTDIENGATYKLVYTVG